MIFKKIFKKNGFTLIETLVGVAVFLVISIASFQAYVSLFNIINLNQYKIIALNLANEQFEIIRNLSYSDVGLAGGIPNGKLTHTQDLTRSGIVFTVITTIRNIDLPFDGAMGSTTKPDLSPADSKTVEVEIQCATCKNFTPIILSTIVSPKNLETASTNGALLIKVFDSNGAPVQDASVHVVNSQVNPNIVIDDVTDIDGFLQIVDAPPGTNAYKITVTKSGYSTDRTYTPEIDNASPTNPDATVILQQLTPISFFIDKLSTLSFSSVTASCTAVPSMDFSLTGSKKIGKDIPKYLKNHITDSKGSLAIPNMEWDSYTVKGLDSNYDIVGLNPLNPFALSPNSNQNVSIIVAPKNSKSLLITVKDSATKLPITDASVNVTNSSGYDVTKVTGRGFITQTDWSGGGGQASSTDLTKYANDDGNIDTSISVGDIKLKKVFDSYNLSGWLESSTMDTGMASNFYSFSWLPASQLANTSIKFQFASSSSPPTTWDFKGPDGTSATYYTTSNSTISTIHNGDRYARYKVFLESTSTSTSPNVSDISFTATTSCTPPGQVIFSGLSEGNYNIQVIKDGYTTSSADANIESSWQEKEIILSP